MFYYSTTLRLPQKIMARDWVLLEGSGSFPKMPVLSGETSFD